MFLDITNFNYDKDIIPFTRNGIIVDTSIIKIIIEGLVSVRISKQKLKNLPDYKNLLDFLLLQSRQSSW